MPIEEQINEAARATEAWIDMVSDSVAFASGATYKEARGVVLAADFVGSGGTSGLGGPGRATPRVAPCEGILGRGRWQSRDWPIFWAGLMEVIEQSFHVVSPDAAMLALRSRLLSRPHIQALAGQCGLRWTARYGHGFKKDYSQRILARLVTTGLQAEVFEKHFGISGESTAAWREVHEASQRAEFLQRLIEVHPRDCPDAWGTKPRLRFVDGDMVTLSDGQPTWIVPSHEAPKPSRRLVFEEVR